MMTAQTVIEAFPTLRRVCHSAALTSFANSEEARIYGLRVFGVHQMDFTVVAGCKPCLGLLSTFPRGNAVTGHCLANDVIIRPNFPFGGSWFSRARSEASLDSERDRGSVFTIQRPARVAGRGRAVVELRELVVEGIADGADEGEAPRELPGDADVEDAARADILVSVRAPRGLREKAVEAAVVPARAERDAAPVELEPPVGGLGHEAGEGGVAR